jgi:hypothetical protein
MKLDRRNCLLLLSKLELFGTRITHVMTAPLPTLTVTGMPFSSRSIYTETLRSRGTASAVDKTELIVVCAAAAEGAESSPVAASSASDSLSDYSSSLIGMCTVSAMQRTVFRAVKTHSRYPVGFLGHLVAAVAVGTTVRTTESNHPLCCEIL